MLQLVPALTARPRPTYRMRQLTRDDWSIFRSLRLAALADAPSLMGGDFEIERHYDPDTWRRMAAPDSGATWALMAGHRPAGMTYAKRDPDQADTVIFGGTWIAPAHRGHGLARLFHETRLSWAIEQTGYRWSSCSHRRGNHASQNAILRAGFRLYKITHEQWFDGTWDYEYHYRIDLDAYRVEQAAAATAASWSRSWGLSPSLHASG
ncbi:hypothetical protein CKO28_06030 [Rhodovibrio sodomensis]|uniref:N-acetyltransferase domain-containing protein n=1 Tax=Rhodovibrio sodomensis TaxID=1088 RepID=A0ABS1DB50_9PROT|nr:GNAT family protein [Rhodovibrio sodomensis]MBK1667590.1 hypothetical protein [Rhodovibrio sodomensis]